MNRHRLVILFLFAMLVGAFACAQCAPVAWVDTPGRGDRM